jgi:predicted DNA-binding transcriptional regulator YafY
MMQPIRLTDEQLSAVFAAAAPLAAHQPDGFLQDAAAVPHAVSAAERAAMRQRIVAGQRTP